MKKIVVVMLCLGIVCACSSAVVTPEGTEASYSWVEGALQSTLAGPMPEVVEATTGTLEDLELVGIDSTVDRLKGTVTARLAVGTKVHIGLEAVDFESTAIRIKVGTFGDRSVALQILRNIEKRLGG